MSCAVLGLEDSHTTWQPELWTAHRSYQYLFCRIFMIFLILSSSNVAIFFGYLRSACIMIWDVRWPLYFSFARSLSVFLRFVEKKKLNFLPQAPSDSALLSYLITSSCMNASLRVTFYNKEGNVTYRTGTKKKIISYLTVDSRTHVQYF